MQIKNNQLLKHWYHLNSFKYFSVTMGYSTTGKLFVPTEILQNCSKENKKKH